MKIWIARGAERGAALDRRGRGRPRARRGRPLACDTAHESSLRSFPDRRPAHRRRPHGVVQLVAGARRRGALRAADRRYRPRALDARERRADPRRPALARARLGRGPDLPGGERAGATARPSRRCSRAGARTARAPPPRTSRPTSASTATTAASAAREEATERSGCASPTRARRRSTTSCSGRSRTPNRSLDDLVIARADGTPLYNLAVAVDDLDAEITHVIRGNDHLTNTAKQLLVIEALGRAAAALRPPAAAARAGRPQALQAPRRRLRAGAARRRLPAERGAQLRRAARLGRRRRRDDPPDRGAGPPLRHRARAAQPGAVRRAEAALAQRPLHARADARRADGGARGASTAAPACGPRRRSAPRSSRPSPTSGRCAVSSTTAPSTTRRRASAGSASGAARARRRRATRSPRRSRSSRPTIEAALTGVVERCGCKPADVYQPLRVALAGRPVSPGIFETVAVLGRDESLSGSTRALNP